MKMELDVSFFAPFIKTYTASGQIYKTNGKIFPCNFICGQTKDGNNICQCYIRDYQIEEESFDSFVRETIYVSGYTSSGEVIHLHNSKVISQKSRFIDSLITSSADNITIDYQIKSRPKEIKFFITNLDVLLIPKINVDNYIIEIKAIDFSSDRFVKLRTTKKTDVTSVISIKLPNESITPDTEIGNVKKIITDICNLFSLTQGCKIQWLYMELYSDSGQLIEIYHQKSNKSLSFSSKNEMLQIHRWDVVNSLINDCLNNYNVLVYDISFDRCIELYINALLENNYDELSGLMLVAILDYIAGKMYPNVTSYPDKLKLLVKAINLDMGQDEITKMNLLRNKLAHESSYYNINEPIIRYDHVKKQLLTIDINIESKNMQYKFILSFISKIMLGLLGYNGEYIDRYLDNTVKLKYIS